MPPVATEGNGPRPFGEQSRTSATGQQRDLSAAARDVAALVVTERQPVAARWPSRSLMPLVVHSLDGERAAPGDAPGAGEADPAPARAVAVPPPVETVPAPDEAPPAAVEAPPAAVEAPALDEAAAAAAPAAAVPPPEGSRREAEGRVETAEDAPEDAPAGEEAVTDEPGAGDPAAEAPVATPAAEDRPVADPAVGGPPARRPAVHDAPVEPVEDLFHAVPPRGEERARVQVYEPAPPPGGPVAAAREVPEPSPTVTFSGTPAARVALVTGAGRGIGRALALGLGRAGVSVALLGRSPGALEDVAAEVASHGVGASWAGADVRDYAQVHNAVERLQAALGEVDLLINNAGVIEPVEVPVWDAGPETWWHVVETDLRGPFHCVHAVVPGMVERGGGRVINLSSGVGAGDRDIYSAYAAAKAGLFRITGSLHLAGYDRGLRAFDISPGTVRTDMTSLMPVHAARQDWTPVERVVDLVVAVAAGRLDAWSGGYLRAGVDTAESLDAAELRAGETGLPPWSRRLGILPYGPDDPLNTLGEG